jgi:putative two-component system response regulator
MNEIDGVNILIVDDTLEIREYLAELVESLGATPSQAASGRDALASLAIVVPDLILLDIEMPEMDGFAVCRNVKSNPATLRVPIIVITSLGAIDDRVQGINCGADDFLTKPVHVAEFKAKIESLLRIKRLNDSLESAENVIFTLAATIEAKDAYTQGHTERVTAYASDLGRAVGCTDKELISLRQGGTLHDIGKIGVPDHILNKPGKLTPEEFHIMRRHAAVGFDICAPMKTLAHTLPIIRWHHEKPNGRGYPDGLKGSEIPRLALIMAVADVFDALTSKRSYKDAYTQDIALSILTEEGHNGRLDKDLVNVFVTQVIPVFHSARATRDLIRTANFADNPS